MTADNEINVLFRNNSISQVEENLSKIRFDTDKKREDLRVMVGERYRDLIEAADTISEMKISAHAVVENIHTMEGLCESLQQRGLIGFKTSTPSRCERERHPGALNKRELMYSVAVEVKVLVSVPEILWSLTERQRYLDAAQLWLFAQHTHTALTLMPGASKVLCWFPVIERQMSSIDIFLPVILNGCAGIIAQETDDNKTICDGLICHTLLGGKKGGVGAGGEASLALFLKLREDFLLNSLKSEPNETAKSQLENFISLFLATLEIVFRLFYVDGDTRNVLDEHLSEVLAAYSIEGSEGGPVVTLLQESAMALSFLPKAVLQFRPSVPVSRNEITNEKVKMRTMEWLTNLLQKSSPLIAQLLSYSKSVKSLSSIHQCIENVFQKHFCHNVWNQVSITLTGSHVDPWNLFLQDLVKSQAQDVILCQLNCFRESFVKMTRKLIQDIICDQRVLREEGDISHFVWSESMSDIPDKVGWCSISQRNYNRVGGLYNKTRGYTNRVQNVCQFLNEGFQSLLKDVFSFEFPDSDFSSLLDFVEKKSHETILMMISDMKCLSEEEVNLAEGEESVEEWLGGDVRGVILGVLGRILRGVGELSLVFGGEMNRHLSLESESWLKCQAATQEASQSLMTKCLVSLSMRAKIELFTRLKSCLSGTRETSLIFFASFESIDIEEEGEQGQCLKSTIRLPCHPSPPLAQVVTRLCSAINCIAPHTIPRICQQNVSTATSESLFLAYEEISRLEVDMEQPLCLQIIFDLRFIQMFFVERQQKNLLLRSASLIEFYEKKIDPFDLEVFSPHLTTRIKMATFRAQVLYASLIPRDRHPPFSPFPSALAASGNNCLPIVASSDIPRFCNVPIPMSAARQTTNFQLGLTNFQSDGLSLSNKTESQANLSMSNRVKSREVTSAALSASRSAASIFSAMSSSWFGGGGIGNN